MLFQSLSKNPSTPYDFTVTDGCGHAILECLYSESELFISPRYEIYPINLEFATPDELSRFFSEFFTTIDYSHFKHYLKSCDGVADFMKIKEFEKLFI